MHTNHLVRLVPASFSGLVLVVACASPPPPAPPPAIPAATSVATTPAPPPEEPLAPGEVRCGIDDGPVPIGERDDDLRLPGDPTDRFAVQTPFDNFDGAVVAKRMMLDDVDIPPPVDAAKAYATMRWTLGEGQQNTAAFVDRVQQCRDLAEASDAGAQRFSVRIAAGGAPLSVRPGGPREQTRYAACLAASLCSLGSQPQGTPSRRSEARFETVITPPVFTGTVSLSFRGDRTGAPLLRAPMPSHGRRGRRAPMPPEPPPTPADLAYIAKMVKAAEPGALACAKRTPPNGMLFVGTGPLKPLPPPSPYKKVDMAMPPPQPPVARSAQLYQQQMTACFIEAVQAVLVAPPKSFSTTGKVSATAQYIPGPEAPPPP